MWYGIRGGEGHGGVRTGCGKSTSGEKKVRKKGGRGGGGREEMEEGE